MILEIPRQNWYPNLHSFYKSKRTRHNNLCFIFHICQYFKFVNMTRKTSHKQSSHPHIFSKAFPSCLVQGVTAGCVYPTNQASFLSDCQFLQLYYNIQSKVYISFGMSHFYGTEFEILAGFGLIGSNENCPTY